MEFSSPRRTNAATIENDDDDDIMAELLSAFSPEQTNGDNRFFELSMSNLVSVIQVARNLGIADLTPLGESLIISQPGREFSTGLPRNQPRSRHEAINRSHTPAHCRKELQFHAMLLSPHQIELIFVLCTLLSGRRKVSIQKKFAELGLAKVLRDMYDRMSWDSPPYVGESLEHIHGPGCECNPESAIRVQFLRLIHNFFDRDFLGNSNKLLILSSKEKELINSAVDSESIRVGLEGLLNEDRGTLSQIIRTLMREPSDSIYRFWLSACVENFLRGCGQVGQLFVAHSGILQHVTQHIVKSTPSSNNSLQTAFDLMGEMVKCNTAVLEMLEGSLDDNEFRHFAQIIMDNLVDSNVFVRSLFLSLEMMSYDNRVSGGMIDFGFHFNSLSFVHDPTAPPSSFPQHSANGSNNINAGLKRPANEEKLPEISFLTDSWVQFSPSVQSNRALDLFKGDGKSREEVKKKLKELCTQKRRSNSPAKKALASDVKSIFDADSIPYRCNIDFHDDVSMYTKIQHSSQQKESSSVLPGPAISEKESSTTIPLQRRSSNSAAQKSSVPPSASTFAEGKNLKLNKSGGDFYSGVFETLKDFRKATDNLMKFGSKSSNEDNGRQFSTNPIKMHKLTSGGNSTISLSSSDGSTKVDRSEDDGDEFDIYKTPPEPPRFGTAKFSPSFGKNVQQTIPTVSEVHSQGKLSHGRDANTTVEKAGISHLRTFPSQIEATTFSTSSTKPDIKEPSYSSPSTILKKSTGERMSAGDDSATTNFIRYIPSSLFRISVFLAQEKVSILLRLISTVTLRTVNHENICCLNTTLLILLFEHKRLLLP